MLIVGKLVLYSPPRDGPPQPGESRVGLLKVHSLNSLLTHWGRDKMDAISQTTFFKCIFLNENAWISINISLMSVPNGPINNIPALVQIMAWRRSGDKSFSEPLMVRLLTHICVTRPQWVKDMISRNTSFLWILSYLTGVTTAELQRHLSNIDVIFNI